ncbi:HAD family phosphatase [Parvularcula sp. IMCC14364]|uniref:HAD family hydrolase n=1 Tax=Parvularcula sp. IMCC14364 TaxID=3067902 RepID=UPI002740A70E|nr:HAD-IA family hydrolase [Parvularcula sp. IMCC14364]
MIEAIIFDCDGVLVDSEVVGLEDTAAFMRSKGFDWQAADLVRLFTGLRDDVFAARLGEEYGKVLGRPPTEAEAGELFTAMIENRRRNRHMLQAVPGAEGMVQELAALPFKRAVASSTRIQFLHDKLTRFDLWDYFAPHAYSAELVDHGKPAPDIFLYAAEKIAVDPARCVVIEDSANGVKAGIDAGMVVWGFTGGGHCYDGHGDRLLEAGAVEVIDSHLALRARFKGLQRAVTET